MNFKINRKFPPNSEDLSPVKWKECTDDPDYIICCFQKYLDDLKERGAKIIIGDFYEEVARKVMFPCKRIDNAKAKSKAW